MTLTLSIDDSLLQQAQRVAQSRGLDVSELIRDYLVEITSASSAEREVEELRRLSYEGQGRSRGWQFDRDEIHERP